jgi:hypothetical protein
MLLNLRFFIILFFITVINLSADNCSDPSINCFNVKSPYRVCYTDQDDPNLKRIITLCLLNPLNPQDNFYIGNKTVLKFNNMPTCIEFDDSGPNEIFNSICGNSQCSTGVVFHKNVVDNDIKYANNLWRCLCFSPTSSSSTFCNCTIKVKFIDNNTNEFENPKLDYSSNSTDFIKEENIINNSCQIPCNNIIIYLNNTVQFTEKIYGSNYYSGHFYITSDVVDNWNWPSGYAPSSYSLRWVIARELGKIFGFGLKPINGACNEVANSLHEDIDSWKFDHLNNYDKCAFKKLYCPTYLNVENENEPNILENIKMLIDSKNNFDKLEIYDLLGSKILEQNVSNFNFDIINNVIENRHFVILNLYDNHILISTLKVFK